MPVVPTEQNKVGIAGLTEARLEPGDFSGSGLQALGSGLQRLGEAGQGFGQVVAQMDDAAVKEGYNSYVERSRPTLRIGDGAFFEKQGGDAVAAVPETIQAITKVRDEVRAGLANDRQRKAFDRAVGPRMDEDLTTIYAHADSQARVWHRQQTQGVMSTSADDAVDNVGTPMFGGFIATGLRQMDDQAAAEGWTPELKAKTEIDYISGIHRRAIDSLASRDLITAAQHLRHFSDHMTPADRAATWATLRGPLLQAQAVADLDMLDMIGSPTAPLTPPGDREELVAHMFAISETDPSVAAAVKTQAPAAGGEAGGTADLAALVQRYQGNAAKAWAASRLGGDAVDALVARHGANWFGALPEDIRRAVGSDMGMLRAADSPRLAPFPEKRAELARRIEDQSWTDARKQNVRDELKTRIGLTDRSDRQRQDIAKEAGLALAEALGPKFTSVNQLPPAVRRDLPDDALAALTLRAERNVHPVTVAPGGAIAWRLNQEAANDPARFAREDIRLYRDRLAPEEYETLDRAQKAWGEYPPAATGVTHQRATERVGQWFAGEDHAAAAGQETQPGSVSGRGVAAALQPIAYSPSPGGADGVAGDESDSPGGSDGSASGPNQNPDRNRAGRPAVAKTNSPIDPTIPEGTPSHHPGGKYHLPNSTKIMAGNQHVRDAAIQQENSATVRADLQDPLVAGFLDLLSWSEGTTKDKWNTRHRRDPALTDLSKFPYQLKQPVGRYQIEPDTYDEIAVARLGLSDFSAESQDMTAAMHFRMLKVTDALQKGDLAGAIRAASAAWASMPVSAKDNRSALPVMVNGKPKINPKTGNVVYQGAHDYSQVVATYKSILKSRGVPDSVINNLKY
jgi:muramidase (phage lysozyme)